MKEVFSQNDPARVEAVHLGDVAQAGYLLGRVVHVVEGEDGERAEHTVSDKPLNWSPDPQGELGVTICPHHSL